MSTAGERLVQLSGLSGVGAAAHLLAISQGAGNAPGATIYTSQTTVLHELMRTTRIQRQECGVEVTEVTTRPVVSCERVRSAVETNVPAHTSVVTSSQQRVARTKVLELWIVSARDTRANVLCAPKSVVTRRRSKAVAVI